MSKNEIIFMLNDTEKIVIPFEEGLDKVHCCYETPIFLYQGSQKSLLTSESLRENMYILSNLLGKALNSSLPLHESIVKDIGYLENEHLQGRSGLVYIKLESRNYWVGSKNNLWSPCLANSNLTTWIYNDVDDFIIFEVTLLYPYHFSDPAETGNVISYDQWIQGYKPYLIRRIPRTVAEQWLVQANKILQQIEKNVERFRA
jgi:hypothetical protein